MNPFHPAVARRAANRCEYCRAPEWLHNGLFEVEHVTPVAAGGADTTDNLALACRTCNLRKGAETTGTDPRTGQVERLFHPRNDAWDDHFAFDAGTYELIGLTAVSRATIAVLDLNDFRQLSARQFWVRVGQFP